MVVILYIVVAAVAYFYQNSLEVINYKKKKKWLMGQYSLSDLLVDEFKHKEGTMVL